MGIFAKFDSIIQTPFTDGTNAVVSSAISAVSGPVTALVVLWLIVTGIMIMRGDITVRTGMTRLVSTSLVIGLATSAEYYNGYVTNFFMTGLPSWIDSSVTGIPGTAPSAAVFDHLLVSMGTVFLTISKNLNIWNVLYCTQLAILQVISVIPIGIDFLVYELSTLMMDVVICIGPFILLGYLFSATRGVADKWVGKLISLTILKLLIDVVLAIIVDGYNTYLNSTLAVVQSTSDKAVDMLVADQMLLFLTLGTILVTFLPGLAAYLGGGISVSPLSAANSATNVAKYAAAVIPK